MNRREDDFEHFSVRHAFGLQAKVFGIAGPRFRESLRIVKRESKLQVVPVQTAPTFRYAQFVTKWHAPLVRPEPWIQTRRLYDECVAFPIADGVSVKPRSGIFRHLSAVGPDFTPYAKPFKNLHGFVLKWNELKRSAVNERTEQTGHVRISERIIPFCRKAGSRSLAGLVRIELRET
jgi:hypothetical protein